MERSGGDWRCRAVDTDTAPGGPQWGDDLPDRLTATGVKTVHRLEQGRSRLYAPLPDVDRLSAPDEGDVRDLCRRPGCTAVVLYAPEGEARVRTRVFTTSPGGREDAATGQAAAGAGALLAGEGRTGDVDVVQGPRTRRDRGHLSLRLDAERQIGGRERPVLTGRTPRVDGEPSA